MIVIKVLAAIVFTIVTADLALAEGQTQQSKRVESLRTKHIKLFKEINAAFEAKDNAKVSELLDKLEDDLTLSTTGNKLGRFNRAITSGDFEDAKRRADKLLNNDLSAIERANIHKSLGDFYLSLGNTESALNEYKKILELPVQDQPNVR